MDFSPYRPPVAQAGEVDISKTLEVTFSRATKVWWSLLWRAILFGTLAGGAAGFVIGIICAAARVAPEQMPRYGGLAGLAVGIPVGIWVVQTVLKKSWSDFRIVLVPNT
jgi:F0F1-type ATP synthase membrane subunit c/vacuolar-type H+-ATPase subunit K